MTKINRKKYDINFKKETITSAGKEGYSLGEATIRFGVSKSTMALWKQQFSISKIEVSSGNGSTISLFIAKAVTKRTNKCKERARYFKKALAYFAANPQQ